MSQVESTAYTIRHDASERLKRAQADYDLADAWIGLDSLLKGAWGTENLIALGGGRAQIEKAHAVLGEMVEARDTRPSDQAYGAPRAGGHPAAEQVVRTLWHTHESHGCRAPGRRHAMSEQTKVPQRPPDSFWREVPCGHPQDPVAWWGEHGPFCHCGGGLDTKDAVEIPTGAPGPVVQCGKCGCHPAIPPRPEREAVNPWTSAIDRAESVSAPGDGSAAVPPIESGDKSISNTAGVPSGPRRWTIKKLRRPNRKSDVNRGATVPLNNYFFDGFISGPDTKSVTVEEVGPVSEAQLRDKFADTFRDWLHETGRGECNRSVDECPDWPLAYELADRAVAVLSAAREVKSDGE